MILGKHSWGMDGKTTVVICTSKGTVELCWPAKDRWSSMGSDQGSMVNFSNISSHNFVGRQYDTEELWNASISKSPRDCSYANVKK